MFLQFGCAFMNGSGFEALLKRSLLRLNRQKLSRDDYLSEKKRVDHEVDVAWYGDKNV
jgi:hypothetical protein